MDRSSSSRVKLIFNPSSGSGLRPDFLRLTAERIKRHGFEVDAFEVKQGDDAQAESRKLSGDYMAVVVAGGDGTVNAVYNGLCKSESQVPMAILPIGTANVIAKELKVARNVDGLCDTLQRGELRRMDAGQMGDWRFLMGAGAGVDAAVVHSLSARRNGNIWVGTYAPHILSVLSSYGFPPISVEVDGEMLAEGAGQVAIGNVRNHGMGVPITPKADPFDGRLDVCVFQKGTVADMLRYVSGVYSGTHLKFGDVLYAHGTRVRVTSEHKVPVQVDGESAGFLPAEFEVLPGAATVLVPAR